MLEISPGTGQAMPQVGWLGKLLIWLRLDVKLLSGLMLLSLLGLVILYSAVGQNEAMLNRQVIRLGLAFVVMLIAAQFRPHFLYLWSPWLYAAGLVALLLVILVGDEGKGAQRWLDLGVIRFQPSEIMKLATPMMMAWYFSRTPIPPRLSHLLIGLLIMGIPMLLIMLQPDLGTSLLVASAGFFCLFLAGISFKVLLSGAALTLIAAPLFWFFGMHAYQQQRVLTFLNPESDPLGAGYHIIQSKIAIGSGGMYGKGWLNGTQAHLEFLPERTTDFIFSVFGEEFGFFGGLVLLCLYLFIALRGMRIALIARTAYSQLLAGSIALTFFVYLVVNVGMVMGLLPVVGVPLPLISYGGTSMVTLMAGFGILMSVYSNRRFMRR